MIEPYLGFPGSPVLYKAKTCPQRGDHEFKSNFVVDLF